jgi:hypothetical protein
LRNRSTTSSQDAIPGIGPALAAVLITYFDPRKAHHISGFWKYAGLDVAEDGLARSRRKEHLIERAYTTRDGKEATRLSTTYNPWLRMKLHGGLAPSFLRSASPRRKLYDNYRTRIMTDPNRIKMAVGEWKKLYAAGEDVRNVWPPARIHRAAMRYMIKIFLADFWLAWRRLEGLPVTPTYEEARRGRLHGQAAE